jgi:PAS domain S-box-containing protein
VPVRPFQPVPIHKSRSRLHHSPSFAAVVQEWGRLLADLAGFLRTAALTRSVREYAAVAAFALCGVVIAAILPITRDAPGLFLLSVALLITMLAKAQVAWVGVVVSAAGLLVIRPLASFPAEFARAFLLFLLTGAAGAIKYGRERALEASTQYRLLFEQNPLPMWLYDSESFEFLEVNEAAVGMYGYSRTELMAMTLHDVTVGEAAPSANPTATPGPFDRSARHRTKDGRTLDVLIRASVVERGGRRACLASLEDLTERFKLEHQLRHAQKMDAIGQLAGGVAHDFNNIVTAIQGYATLVLSALEDDDERREDILEIRRAAERATGLTRQLLTFSRKQVIDVRVVSMSPVVSEIAPMLRRLVDETISIEIKPAALGAVRADPMQLQQVLVNLVVNARDAIDGSGRIVIETEDVQVASGDPRCPPLEPGMRYVVLAVADSGCGMSAATKARIFEPFFTTKPLGRGTGLGLSTVHEIVKQSGGHLDVESVVGSGSRFAVYLPSAQERPADQLSAPATPASRGAATILLVEDEEGVRHLATKVLQRAGYTVYPAASPSEALTIASQLERSPDLLLTDLILPDMSGKAVALHVQSRHPRCRVLYMSGHTEDWMLTQGKLDPGAAFLSKPFVVATLLRQVQDVLTGSHLDT